MGSRTDRLVASLTLVLALGSAVANAACVDVPTEHLQDSGRGDTADEQDDAENGNEGDTEYWNEDAARGW